MACPPCVDQEMRPPVSLKPAASSAAAEAEFQLFLKDHLSVLHDTISSKCGDLVRKLGDEQELHAEAARAAEREKSALQEEVDRLKLILDEPGEVWPRDCVSDALILPPAVTPSTAVEGDDLRNNVTLPGWKTPPQPMEMPPLPGTIVDDAGLGLLTKMPARLAEADVPAPEEEPQRLEVQSFSLQTFAEGRVGSKLLADASDRMAALVDGGDVCCREQPCECRAPEPPNVLATAVEVPPASGAFVGQADPSQAIESIRKDGRRVAALAELQNAEEAAERSDVVGRILYRSVTGSVPLRWGSKGRCGSKDSPVAPSAILLRRSTSRSFGASKEPPSTRMQALREGVRSFACHNAFMKGFSQPPPAAEGRLADLVGSRGFELFCSFAITLNAVFIALASNHAMKNLHDPSTNLMDGAELLFCLFYTVELSLRFMVHKQYYIYSSEWAWNSFDLLLVMVSLQEMLVNYLPMMSTGISLSFLRILRVMKMVRLFRVVRLMRMFRELRLIWNSIFGCVKAIFWAMMLIASVSFMVGVCFVQASTAYLQENYDSISPDDVLLIKHWWGSVQTAMLTLYKSVTGGHDWAEAVVTLWPIGTAYYMLFLLYILFYTCVICNTITSLFVESTMFNADKDHQAVVQNALENTEEYIEKLRGWFSSVDTDGSGCITYDEFCDKLQDPQAIAFASTLNIELTDLKQFFAGLSNNGARAVDLETFVVGCIRMRGPAKSIDLLELIFNEREAAERSRQQLSEFENFCLSELKSLRCSWERFLSEEVGHS
eukprot:TRINITY_DN6497_c0_g1_i1.p1 TRINITY_DN6497_c0_g1~~TRINITY_DN6497_c0_g1_i1.p1  ORF type:complete len:775 (-),score=128.36 TRINITY_DN6497_c0_g1_i1:227-2551(-)